MHTTPVVIKTMLHIYSCPQLLRDAPAVTKALFTLRRHGLIETNASISTFHGLRCTKRGLCWINMLLDTPLPASAFLDPRNNEAVSSEFRDIGPGFPTPITDPEEPVVNIHDVEEEAKHASEVGPSAADLF